MARHSPATPARRGGGASPFSKLAQNTASPASARLSSPRSEPRDPSDAFLGARTQEGTHHRKLRALLQEFVREATKWEEEHLDMVRWASQASQAWDDVHEMHAHAERLVTPLMHLEEARTHLVKMHARLGKYAARMDTLVVAAQDMLRDAAASGKGLAEPMWATWSMARFGTSRGAALTQSMACRV